MMQVQAWNCNVLGQEVILMWDKLLVFTFNNKAWPEGGKSLAKATIAEAENTKKQHVN